VAEITDAPPVIFPSPLFLTNAIYYTASDPKF
jgi:hypothetical protein